MIDAQDFTRLALLRGFKLYTGVPCSYLKPFINSVIDDPDLQYVGATNEGDAVAIAAGAELAGMRSVVMFQNSGFGNTVNPLTSLNPIFKIPSLIMTTWRGEPGGAADEPQHDLMGEITPKLFDLMGIPWEFVPQEASQLDACLERATAYMDRERKPFGLIMKKDTCAPYKLKTKGTPQLISDPLPPAKWSSHRPSRREVLTAVQNSVTERDLVVATTGFTGRALYALEDRDNQFYMVGSMGCAATFGLGLAIARPDIRAVVLDGDGAALMRLGALATLGYERPQNLVHILLDNEVHDSTGGQSTVSHSVDLAQVARACGYTRVFRATTAAEVAAYLRDPTPELTMIHIKTAPGEAGDLPRPTVTPVQVADRLRSWLATRNAPRTAPKNAPRSLQ